MNADDPLLPAPDPSGWMATPPAGEDAVEHSVTAAMDYMNFHAIAWPARDSAGRLVAPPDEHVLDQLARTEGLVAEEESLIRPAAGTVAVVAELPICDICDQERARYDGIASVGNKSATAFSCPACYDRYGSGTLGATGDCYLMTLPEVSPAVRAVCDELTKRHGRASLWA